MQLQEELKQIEEAGATLVGISYDSVETLKGFSDKNHISFSLLSDPDSNVINNYHIRNEAVRSGSSQSGIPHPATFVVGKNGSIRAKLPGSIRRRHSTSDLVAKLNTSG